MNSQSSRSHSVLTIIIDKRVCKDKLIISSSSKLHLIDLAGSENQKTAESKGHTFKEATNINTSLMELGQVISQLYEKSKGKAIFVN